VLLLKHRGGRTQQESWAGGLRLPACLVVDSSDEKSAVFVGNETHP
jgi:hypothetical protein